MGPKRIAKDAKQSLTGWVKSDFGNNLFEAGRADEAKKKHNVVAELRHPKTSSQLVVQKKKVEELKLWLESTLQKKKASILLLKGPPGSGKTVTLKLLAKEINAEICNWEEPLRALSSQEWDYRLWCNTGTGGIFSDKNPTQHLEDFMKRHNKYCKLPIASSGNNMDEQKFTKKIIVMKNFFSVFHNNVDSWHRLLVQHYNHGSIPLVLIWTEVNDDFYYLSQAFPNEVQLSIHLTTIQIADTFVLKALQFATSEIQQFPRDNLQEIVDSCNGDLQFAFNTLKLMTKGIERWDTVSQTPRGGKKRAREKQSSSSSSRYASKDHSYEFMHLLGKILYAKRTSSDQPLSLTCHLQAESRHPLKDNPSHLVDQLSQNASKVSLYLHQNFCNTFSCIDDICKAANYLSSADILHSQSLENEKFVEFSLFVAILGTMHSHVASKPSSWLPLKKPEYYSLQERKSEFKLTMKKARPTSSFEHDCSIEIFPYLKLISSEEKESSANLKRGGAPFASACNAYAAKLCPTNAVDMTFPKEGFRNPLEEDEIVIEEFDET